MATCSRCWGNRPAGWEFCEQCLACVHRQPGTGECYLCQTGQLRAKQEILRAELLKVRNGFVSCYKKVGNVRAWNGTAEDIDWLVNTMDAILDRLDGKS